MSKINLEPGETELHNQTLFYQPSSGAKINGKMTITNKRVIYEYKYDATVAGMILGDKAEGCLEIPKEKIKTVDTEKSFIAKKIIVTTEDGTKHTFNAGMMSIDKAVEAMKLK